MNKKELKSEITKVLRERSKQVVTEATYKFGKVEYTKKGLTPTDILDLVHAYIKTPITKVIGRSHNDRIVVTNDIGTLTGRRPEFPTKTGKKPALMHVLLKNKLVTKNEYLKLYKDLVIRHAEVVKYLNNADPIKRSKGKNSGESSAERAARKDMSVSYESVTEDTLTEGKFKKDDLVYNKRTKTVGIVRLGDDKSGEVKTDADGNVDVDELEKYNPIKNNKHKNVKVAPSTEKEINKRGLFNPFKNESINEGTLNEAGYDQNTGLYYINEVPFTQDTIKALVQSFKGMKAPKLDKQFIVSSPSITIKDRVNGGSVVVDVVVLKELVSALKKFKLAKNGDFKNESINEGGNTTIREDDWSTEFNGQTIRKAMVKSNGPDLILQMKDGTMYTIKKVFSIIKWGK